MTITEQEALEDYVKVLKEGEKNIEVSTKVGAVATLLSTTYQSKYNTYSPDQVDKAVKLVEDIWNKFSTKD